MKIHVIITNTDEGIYSDLYLTRDDAVNLVLKGLLK